MDRFSNVYDIDIDDWNDQVDDNIHDIVK